MIGEVIPLERYIIGNANIIHPNSKFTAFERSLVSNDDVNTRTGSRILTLLSKFGLEDHLMTDNEEEIRMNSYLPTDVAKVVQMEKEKYQSFFDKQLSL